MAWTWVKQIKNKYTGQIMDLVLPIGFTYSGNSGAPTSVTHEYQRYNTSHPEYKDHVTAMSLQTIDPQFCGADKVGTSYSFAGIGGGLSGSVGQRQTFRNEWTGTIKNFSGTTIASWYQYATYNYANNGNYRFDHYFAGLCAVVNDETQQMFFGFITGGHTIDVSDPWYYSWRVDLMMEDYSNRNVYSIFAKMIPGGGGEGPYQTDDYDEPIQGDPTYDDTSDTIETSPIPIAAATRSGMITAFVPTWGEIQSVADALLDPNIFQILASTVVRASDVIIGLSVFPCTIPANSTATVTANFLGLNIGTGVIAHVADNQYVEIDCGDLEISEYWGNCLDYNPYTNISIFLPFCGMYELDADEVMGKTINVSYRIDIFSGACLATIKIDGSVFYQYTGQCSSQIPLNSVSFDNFLSSMLDVGIATATGVAAVKGAAGELAAASKAFTEAKSSEAKGAFEDYLDASANYTKVKEHSGEALLGASVNGVIGGKGFYSHAGAVGGSPGFLAVKKPFVIIKRPEQVMPSMYGKFHGYPANTTANLNDLVGYTEVGDIRLNIPDATVDEIIECEQLLKGGVVL